jgi:hypothetical protein
MMHDDEGSGDGVDHLWKARVTSDEVVMCSNWLGPDYDIHTD